VTEAARLEKWTKRDWQHWEKMRAAFEDTFGVTYLQRDAGGHGLYAYYSNYVNFEAAMIPQSADKPVLWALHDLSKALLRVKTAAERE
jgi:hypothetical protein